MGRCASSSNQCAEDDFDIGLERILRKKGGGKAVALAARPMPVTARAPRSNISTRRTA